MIRGNIKKNLSISDEKEIFKSIFDNNNVKIERIVSNGHVSKEGFWYNQEDYEFVMVLEGFAILEFENERVEMDKYDYIVIEPHEKHKVVYTHKPTVWLCVFFK